jgi:hypothetical protein
VRLIVFILPKHHLALRYNNGVEAGKRGALYSRDGNVIAGVDRIGHQAPSDLFHAK